MTETPTPTPLLPGTTMAPTDRQPRLIMAVDGMEKSGKTEFALSLPKPLVYLDFDLGTEGVIEKAPDADLVITGEPFYFAGTDHTWGQDEKNTAGPAVMAAAKPLAQRFRDTYRAALTEPVVQVGRKRMYARSVVVDTATAFWNLVRLVEFGRLEKVMPQHYAKPNGIMEAFILDGFRSDVNVVWLHRVQREWVEGVGNAAGHRGKVLERQGYKGMAYAVMANVLLHRVPASAKDGIVSWRPGDDLYHVDLGAREDEGDLGFRALVGKCRHNPNVEGECFRNELISFPLLAATITDTDPILWETNR